MYCYPSPEHIGSQCGGNWCALAIPSAPNYPQDFAQMSPTKAFLDLHVTLFLHLPLLHRLMSYLQGQGFSMSCLYIFCTQSRAWHIGVSCIFLEWKNPHNSITFSPPSLNPTHITLGMEAVLKPNNTIYLCTESLNLT